MVESLVPTLFAVHHKIGGFKVQKKKQTVQSPYIQFKLSYMYFHGSIPMFVHAKSPNSTLKTTILAPYRTFDRMGPMTSLSQTRKLHQQAAAGVRVRLPLDHRLVLRL